MTKVSMPFYFEVGGSPAGYDEAEMATYFKSIMAQNGVLPRIGNALAVYQHTAPDMSVNVPTGAVWINGRWYYSNAVENLAIGAADSTKDRYDSVVARLSVSSPTSNIDVAVLVGTLATAGTATPAALTVTDTTYELRLATVFVEHGTTAITTAMISDKRYTAECGMAASAMGDWYIEQTTGNLKSGGKQLVMETARITGLGDPSADQDADTKAARVAALAAFVPSGVYLGMTLLTNASDNIVVGSTTNKVVVIVQGAGGGGGGVDGQGAATYAGGGGGGAGGRLIKTFTVTPGATYAYTCGAKGAGGAAGANNGSAGGNSTFVVGATTVTAGGGAGGIGVTAAVTGMAAGGAGGSATNGDVNMPGTPGRYGVNVQNGVVWGGMGGTSTEGGAGADIYTTGGGGSNGNNATGYGAGGGGAISYAASTNFAGGDGSAGCIIVMEYS